MKAVVYQGPMKVTIEDVENPRIESPADALVEITTAGICGSDLHMYEGRTPVAPGMVFGHENMGVVVDVGGDVRSIRKGDRVVMPFNIGCGFCFNCMRGYPNACLTANPHEASASYGQAEYLRVPFADYNCLKLPGSPGDMFEDDFLLLSDAFPTGYHGAELAGVEAGSTVAVFGAGPVGLLAAYSSLLKGASEVYVVDWIPARLRKAEQIGAITIDFSKGDPVDQILDIRRNNPLLREAMRPGEEKMIGVMCGIDAVGYQARSNDDPHVEKPSQVLENLARVVNPTGKVGVVGTYFSRDPRGVNAAAKHGAYTLPWGELFERGIAIGTGQTPVKSYNYLLRDLIMAGRAKPSFIVSHHLRLVEAPDGYEKFEQRFGGYTKVLLNPRAA